MVRFVYTAREHHGVTTPDEYVATQAAFIARKQANGQRFAVHDSTVPLTARVAGNSWIVDCECGAGNAIDPSWGLACCFGCGAIHRSLTVPSVDDCQLIEAVLIERPEVIKQRGWDPGQTLVDLIAENISIHANVPNVAIEAVAAAPLTGGLV